VGDFVSFSTQVKAGDALVLQSILVPKSLSYRKSIPLHFCSHAQRYIFDTTWALETRHLHVVSVEQRFILMPTEKKYVYIRLRDLYY
jgi:hypothetical protein